MPFGYRYERWQLTDGKLVVTFKHSRSADRFTFHVKPLPPGMECDLQGSFLRTLQMDGNKVYYGGWGGEWIAWRCVTSPKTHKRYLLSVHSSGPPSRSVTARISMSRVSRSRAPPAGLRKTSVATPSITRRVKS